MALLLVGDNLNIGNTEIHIQFYSDVSLIYVKVVSVKDFTNYEISQDGLTMTIFPSAQLEGEIDIEVTTSQGIVKVPVNYLSRYLKETKVRNTIDEYYPTAMFEWVEANPKTAEISAFEDSIAPSIDLTIKVPITKEFHKNWAEYCSSQLLGIAMQLALTEYQAGNFTTLVVLEDIIVTISQINDMVGTTDTVFIPDEASMTTPKKASVTSSRFPASSTMIQATGATPEPTVPAYIGGIMKNFPTPFTYDPPFGLYFTVYKPDYSPLKFKDITVADGPSTKNYTLKYGATKTEVDTLRYVKSNKVVYVGQTTPLAEDYFIMSTSPTALGKGFNNPTLSPPPNKGGRWTDGGTGKLTTVLTTWEDIQGMPASNEVIYDRSNIDISELNTTVVLPPYGRLLTKEVDYIPLLNKFNKDIRKIAIRYTGKEYIINISSENIFFTLEGGVGLGLDLGIFR